MIVKKRRQIKGKQEGKRKHTDTHTEYSMGL